MDEKIKELYTSDKASCAFTGLSTVKKSSEGNVYKKRYLDNALRKVPAYVLHRPLRKKINRRMVSVPTINHQFGSDLIEVKHPKSNYNTRYLLVILDHFSRSVWIEPLKTKKLMKFC